MAIFEMFNLMEGSPVEIEPFTTNSMQLKVKYHVNQVRIMTTIERIRKIDYSDVLIWISVLLLVFYVIAKIIGIN